MLAASVQAKWMLNLPHFCLIFHMCQKSFIDADCFFFFFHFKTHYNLHLTIFKSALPSLFLFHLSCYVKSTLQIITKQTLKKKIILRLSLPSSAVNPAHSSYVCDPKPSISVKKCHLKDIFALEILILFLGFCLWF